MSDLVRCPSCSRKLRVSDELRGQPLRCPSCDTTFEPEAPPEEEERRVTERPQPPTDEPRPRENEPCPACGATIPSNVLRCPACRADLEFVEDRAWERGYRARRDCEPHRSGLVLTLGIISVVLPLPALCCSIFGVVIQVLSLALGIAAWVMGARDLRKMRAHTMDPEGYGQAQAGMVCGIIGACMSLLFSVILLGAVVLSGIMVFDIRNQALQAPPPPVVVKQVPAKPVFQGRELLPAPAEEPLELLPMPAVQPLRP